MCIHYIYCSALIHVLYIRTYVHDSMSFPSLPVTYRAALLQKQGSVKAAVGLLDVAVTASSSDPSLYMFRAALNEEVRTHCIVQQCMCAPVFSMLLLQAVLVINLALCLNNLNSVSVFYLSSLGQPCNLPFTTLLLPALLSLS